MRRASVTFFSSNLKGLDLGRANKELHAKHPRAFDEAHDLACGVCTYGHDPLAMCDFCVRSYHLDPCVGRPVDFEGTGLPEDKIACWVCADEMYDPKRPGQRLKMFGPNGGDLPIHETKEGGLLAARAKRRLQSGETFNVEQKQTKGGGFQAIVEFFAVGPVCGTPHLPSLYVDMYSVRRWGLPALRGQHACVLPDNVPALRDYFRALGGDAYRPNRLYTAEAFRAAEEAGVASWKRLHPAADCGDATAGAAAGVGSGF